MTTTTPTMSLTDEARKQANLRVLQRSVDNSIVDILASATHVVLYQFESPTWQKAGVEGSLFLVAHSLPSQYSLVILNRTSPNNWTLPISAAATECQPSDEYVMLRQGTTIHGIWFHNGPERAQVLSMLQQAISNTIVTTTTTTSTNSRPSSANKTTPSTSTSSPSNLSPALRDLHLHNNNSSSISNNNAMGNSVYSHTNNTNSNHRTSQQSPAATSQQSHQSLPPQSPSVPSQQQPLDKKSLQLALLSLIQDERFLDLIHTQYLKVVHARAAKQQQQSSSTPPPSHPPK